MKNIKAYFIPLIVLLSLTLSSCELVGDIFVVIVAGGGQGHFEKNRFVEEKPDPRRKSDD